MSERDKARFDLRRSIYRRGFWAGFIVATVAMGIVGWLALWGMR